MSLQNNLLSEQITANIACEYLSSWSPLNFHGYKNFLENFVGFFTVQNQDNQVYQEM